MKSGVQQMITNFQTDLLFRKIKSTFEYNIILISAEHLSILEERFPLNTHIQLYTHLKN